MSIDPRVFITIGAAFVAANVITAGFILLFFGWRVYKVFVALFAGCAGALSGWFFVAPLIPAEYRFLAPIVLGAVGIAVAIPLQRVVTFAITGALGAGLAAAIGMKYLGVTLDPQSNRFLIALGIGFIIVGTLGAVFYRFIVVLITSSYGALIALGGAGYIVAICIDKVPSVEQLRTGNVNTAQIQTLNNNILWGALAAWLATTVIGMVYQYRTMETPKKSKSKPKDKDKSKSKKD